MRSLCLGPAPSPTLSCPLQGRTPRCCEGSRKSALEAEHLPPWRNSTRTHRRSVRICKMAPPHKLATKSLDQLHQRPQNQRQALESASAISRETVTARDLFGST